MVLASTRRIGFLSLVSPKRRSSARARRGRRPVAARRRGRRRQPEQEGRLEVRDHPTIAGRGSVVEFVDHDVVEPVGRELVQIRCQRLDAGEKHAGVRLLAAVVQAKIRIRLDAAEDIERLAPDLLAMSDEQHPAELRPGPVERGEPRLAEASRHDDQAATVAVEPGLLQSM